MLERDALEINRRLGLRPDWLGRLCHIFGLETDQTLALVESIQAFQRSHQLLPSGVLSSQTRLKIEAVFDIGPSLIGPYLEARCIFDESQTEEALYWRCEELVKKAFGQVYQFEHLPQMLAIRGVRRTQNAYWQTHSARQFVEAPYGERQHFSSDKRDYVDAVIAVFWREEKKHVRLFPAVVNPASVWPKGTAHLMDGQYFYRIGRHRTRERAHIQAIQALASSWPQGWIYDDSEDSIQYIALESASPIEVVRSRGEKLDIDGDDLRRAQIAIAQRRDAYVDPYKIKINIHSSAFEQPSSQGCQNIGPRDYREFMEIFLQQAEKARARFGFVPDIPYLLSDASKLES